MARVSQKVKACKTCNSPFIPKRGTTHLYCSRKCFNASKTNKKIVDCERCGKHIIRRPSEIRKRIFCSNKCRKGEKITILCERCKNPFVFSARQQKYKNRKYCSRACSQSALYKYGPAHDGVKRCTKCSIEKSVSEYRKKKDTQDGYESFCLRCTKEQRFKKLYNASLEEVEGKMCEICGEEKEICLDHDHVFKKPRGALCKRCNSALGLFREDLQILKNAIEYLKRFRPDYTVWYCEPCVKWHFQPEEPELWGPAHE